MSEALLNGESGKKRRSFATIVGFLAGFAILSIVFFKSQAIGGEAWDELADLTGTQQQLDVASRWLQGDASAHFSEVESNWAYYGIAATLPAHLAKLYARHVGFADERSVGRYALHATAFACYLLTLLLTYLILVQITGKKIVAGTGAALLALYPLWLGQSFFNHKDVPTAAFAELAVYGAINLVKARGERSLVMKHAIFLGIATVLIAGLKIAALVLIVPSWVAAIFVLLRWRFFVLLPVVGLLVALGIVAITPVAWSDPINFATTAVEQMAHHIWNGCTLTAGFCIGTRTPEWSTWQYLLAWFMAQLPVLIGIGALAGTVLASWRGPAAGIVAASVVLPLALIVGRNAILYDGLRHVSFAIPLIFILGTMFWSEIAERAGANRMASAFAVALGGLFIWDNHALFPYNYAYFNLPTRQNANQYNYVSDYWGFSLKEAAALPTATRSTAKFVLGYPDHLVQPFVAGDRITVDLGRANELPHGTETLVVAYVRFRAVPPWCSTPEYVTRQLPLGGWPLHLSYAAHCVTP